MINIVGIGPGAEDLMTLASINAIKNAEVLIGGRRNIEGLYGIVDSITEDIFYITADMNGLMRKISESLDKRIVIVASGDPSIYGIAARLIRELPDEEIRVIPGISAVQYIFAAVGLDMNDTYITSAHGREVDYNLIGMLDKVVMVTDRINTPDKIYGELKDRGMERVMIVGSRLSYSDETIAIYYPDEKTNNYDSSLCTVIILKKETYEGRMK